jgi:hypothetical protein
MERFFEWSGITAVTIGSMGLALLIEMGLLKLIFRCLAHAKVDAVGDGASVTIAPSGDAIIRYPQKKDKRCGSCANSRGCLS